MRLKVTPVTWQPTTPYRTLTRAKWPAVPAYKPNVPFGNEGDTVHLNQVQQQRAEVAKQIHSSGLEDPEQVTLYLTVLGKLFPQLITHMKAFETKQGFNSELAKSAKLASPLKNQLFIEALHPEHVYPYHAEYISRAVRTAKTAEESLPDYAHPTFINAFDALHHRPDINLLDQLKTTSQLSEQAALMATLMKATLREDFHFSNQKRPSLEALQIQYDNDHSESVETIENPTLPMLF
jgi:hypothetical protein